MKCPACSSEISYIANRESTDMNVIWWQCITCYHRFTTCEVHGGDHSARPPGPLATLINEGETAWVSGCIRCGECVVVWAREYVGVGVGELRCCYSCRFKISVVVPNKSSLERYKFYYQN